MENFKRYNHLNEYLKNKFGERTLKICIDGGFTCPNRDGTVGKYGCIFCSERGSGEHICNEKSISKQVEDYFLSYKSSRANKFIAYFQNFSNTYDSIDNLRKKYNAALIDDRIVGLEIATRPDCINEEVCNLLEEYTSKYYVCVELGLQTSNEDTAKFINRGYCNMTFTNAVNLLNQYGIDVVTHIMIGLPGETDCDLKNTINFINKHKINGIKIHNVYVVENTVLSDLFNKGLYQPIKFDDYLNSLVYTITHISPEVIVHRISGDAPKDILVAPEWNVHKKWVLNGLDKVLREENLWQGMFYSESLIILPD